MHCIEETSFETEIAENTISEMYHLLRDSVTRYMQNITSAEKIGGAGKIVCIDETHITKKKKIRGVPFRRNTAGNTTIIIAGVELNGTWSGRKETGKTFMVIIEDKTKETFKQIIEKHVVAGSTIWTDGHASYGWLDGDVRFVHESVIHRNREFARLRADGVVISTTAIGGMFSRAKRLLRKYHAMPRKKEYYGLFLGEFMWRSRFVRGDTWRRRGFWEALKMLRLVHKPPHQEENYVQTFCTSSMYTF